MECLNADSQAGRFQQRTAAAHRACAWRARQPRPATLRQLHTQSWQAVLTGAGLRPRLLRVPDTDLRTLARAVCAPDMLREDMGDVRLLAVMRPAQHEGQESRSARMGQRDGQK